MSKARIWSAYSSKSQSLKGGPIKDYFRFRSFRGASSMSGPPRDLRDPTTIYQAQASCSTNGFMVATRRDIRVYNAGQPYNLALRATGEPSMELMASPSLMQPSSSKEQEPEEHFGLHASEHNEIVRLNRHIIILAIDALLYLNGIKGTEYKDNFANFNQLFGMMISKSPMEIQIQHHKIRGILTTERMKTLRIEIMDCIIEHLRCQIQEEMAKADCFGVQIDDLTDINQTSECSITVRFVTECGLLIEWIYDIHNTSPHLTAKELVAILDESMEGTDYETKLVSFVHDSLVLKHSQLQTIQTELTSLAPQALITNNHSLSALLQQRCIAKIKACRLFFSATERIPEFFNEALHRDYLLGFELDSASEWWYHSRLYGAIVSRWDELKSAFENILADPEVNEACIRSSKCFLNDMNDFEYAFLCTVFKTIFEISDKLYYQIRCRPVDNVFCLNEINLQIETINSLRFDENFIKLFETTCLKSKCWIKKDNSTVQEVSSKYKTILNEIIDTILNELSIRFKDLDKLSYFCLADSSKFQFYVETFPAEEFVKMIEFYPVYFRNPERLRSELELFYSDPQFWNIPAYNIPKLIRDKNLDRSDYQEAYKLFVLVLTIHFSVALGKSASKLKDLRAYKGKPISQDSLRCLAYMNMNRDLLNHLIVTKPFHEEIVDKFFCYTKNDKNLFLLYRT